jgi:hypothetical protein
VSLPEAQVTVQIAPAPAARGDVAHQPFDLVNGGGDLVDGRTLKSVLRVPGHSVEQAWECGVDDGGETQAARERPDSGPG